MNRLKIHTWMLNTIKKATQRPTLFTHHFVKKNECNEDSEPNRAFYTKEIYWPNTSAIDLLIICKSSSLQWEIQKPVQGCLLQWNVISQAGCIKLTITS